MYDTEYGEASEYSEIGGNAKKKIRQNETSNQAVAVSGKMLVPGADNTTSAMLVLKNRDIHVRRQTLMNLVHSGFDLNTQTESRRALLLFTLNIILKCEQIV